MSPYRAAPVAPQKAPRASWWRRLTHRDVVRRLDIRRRRHLIRARFRSISWQEAQETATAVHDGHWRAAWQALTDRPRCALRSNLANDAPEERKREAWPEVAASWRRMRPETQAKFRERAPCVCGGLPGCLLLDAPPPSDTLPR